MSFINKTNPTTNHPFHAFFQGWLARQRAFYEQLITISTLESPTTTDKDELIENVLSHYKEYYDEKAKLLKNDVLYVIVPPWLTTFEKTLLWVGGFRPFMVLHIMNKYVSDMVSEQVEMTERLKDVVESEEKILTATYSEIQDSVGFPPLMNKLKKGKWSEIDGPMSELMMRLVEVVSKADELRKSTTMKVVEVLNKDQTIEFLAALAKSQLMLRDWGSQKNTPY